jgi:hypothetical protein
MTGGRNYSDRDYLDLKFSSVLSSVEGISKQLAQFAERVEVLESEIGKINRYKWAMRMLTGAAVVLLTGAGGMALWTLSMISQAKQIWPQLWS